MYNFTTKEQVHNHGYEAVGKTLKALAENMDMKVSGKKSQAGDAWESWFGVNKNSEAEADLPEAGVELKMTGVINTKNGPSAKERLVLNIINYIEEYDKSFETSSFWKKNRYMELGFYNYDKDVNWLDWQVIKAALFTYPEKDLLIIKNDWEIIHSYIRQGRAHELSEGITMYLSACTKGASSKTVRNQHPSLPKNTPQAKQRAYSLKNKYMTYIIREFIFGTALEPNIRIEPFSENEIFEPEGEYYSGESIISDISILEKQSFEEYIIEQLQKFKGMKQSDLASKYKIPKNGKGEFPKSINAMLASRMLGIHGNLEKSEEFFKANITVKTIRITNKGTIKEDMSFPTFKAKELVEEKWETSTLRNVFDSSKFFFVIFQEEENGEYVFRGAKFWTMPEHDLETTVKKAWLATVQTYKNGVHLTYNANQNRVTNNLLTKSDKQIISLRPHASKASYIANNPNADELPTPAIWINKPDSYSESWMTKQCFWLNNDYIWEQIQDVLTDK